MGSVVFHSVTAIVTSAGFWACLDGTAAVPLPEVCTEFTVWKLIGFPLALFILTLFCFVFSLFEDFK